MHESAMPRRTVGELEVLVLLAAIRLGEEEAYAVSIAEELRARAGRKVGRATIYVTLQRLERKGLVSTRLGEPLEHRGGKPRRLVRVEPAGHRAVGETKRAFQSMWAGLELATERDR